VREYTRGRWFRRRASDVLAHPIPPIMPRRQSLTMAGDVSHVFSLSFSLQVSPRGELRRELRGRSRQAAKRRTGGRERRMRERAARRISGCIRFHLASRKRRPICRLCEIKFCYDTCYANMTPLLFQLPRSRGETSVKNDSRLRFASTDRQSRIHAGAMETPRARARCFLPTTGI